MPSSGHTLLCLLTILLVIHFQKGQDVIESWVPFTNEIFLDLKPFISMSIAGVMIYCGDEWCSEGVTMIAGFLGVKNQAAIYIQHSICLPIIILFCLSHSSSAISILFRMAPPLILLIAVARFKSVTGNGPLSLRSLHYLASSISHAHLEPNCG